MHSSLSISSIIVAIFSNLSKNDAFNAALVCHEWEDFALDQAWAVLPCPLLQMFESLLPPGIIAKRPGVYFLHMEFRRSPMLKEWEAFDKYAFRVRNIPRQSLPALLTDLPETINHPLPLFPRLRSLDVIATNTCMYHTSLLDFLAPSDLRRLEVTWREAFPSETCDEEIAGVNLKEPGEESLELFFEELEGRYPRLENFYFFSEIWAGIGWERFAALQPKLVDVYLQGCQCREALFALGKLPSLHSLDVAGDWTYFKDEPHEEGIVQTEMFGTLQDFSGNHIPTFRWIISVAAHLKIVRMYEISEEDLEDLYQAVTALSATLQEVHLFSATAKSKYQRVASPCLKILRRWWKSVHLEHPDAVYKQHQANCPRCELDREPHHQLVVRSSTFLCAEETCTRISCLSYCRYSRIAMSRIHELAETRVTSRYFDKPPTHGAFLEPPRGGSRVSVPGVRPPLRKRAPPDMVEVVIPPYKKRPSKTSNEVATPPSRQANKLLDLKQFAYIPSKSSASDGVNAVKVSVPAFDDPTTSGFFPRGTMSRDMIQATPALNPHTSFETSSMSVITPRKSRKRKASRSAQTDLNNEKKIKIDECACQTIQEHLQKAKPKLIQAVVADDPWKLIIAVTLLNKTRGSLSIPIFWEIMERWPTPDALALAPFDVLMELMQSVGLQKTRAQRFINLSVKYVSEPPSKDLLYKSRTTPQKAKTRIVAQATPTKAKTPRKRKRKATADSKSDDEFSEPVHDPATYYPPTAISHYPGVGRYALDSYRIFSPTLQGGGAPRNEQRSLRRLLVPGKDEDAEWRTVIPEDKELRKYLIWRWALEGVCWTPDAGPWGQVEVADLWNLPHWS